MPEANLRVLERRRDASAPWRVEYTPGHASHHVSYLHEPTGTAFVGDVGGVRVDGGPIIPPTPPPDIDLELWHASLDIVAAWEPARLAITHFGTLRRRRRAPRRRCTRGSTAGRRWRARPTPSPTRRPWWPRCSGRPTPTATQAFLQAMPPETLWPGLDRYWSKNERVDSTAVGQTIELPRTQDPGTGLGGAWRVIVRNDDHNTFDHVAAHAGPLRPRRHRRRGLRDRRPDPQHAARRSSGAATRSPPSCTGSSSTTPA